MKPHYLFQNGSPVPLQSAARKILLEWIKRSIPVLIVQVCLFVLTSSAFVFAQEGDDALFIDAKGHVGIGKNDPKAALDVSGTILGIGMVPPGGIAMYYGDINSNFDADGKGLKNTPYEGWQLCNGENTAPDLRDRFITTSGRKYKMGEQGGADSVTLTVDQIPAHNHNGHTGGQNLALNYPGVFWNSQGVSTGILVSVQKPSPRYRPNLLTTRNEPPIKILPENHSHIINTQGGGNLHENRPSFYALAFIMRLSTADGK